MKLGQLSKQYHPKSPVSLGALWTICTRLNARAVQVRARSSQVAINEQMLCHDVGTTCTGTSSYLFKICSIIGTDFPGVGGLPGDEELVDAPSEDKRLDNPSEEEEEVPSEGGNYHIISYGDLPWVRDFHLKAEDTRGGRVLTARPRMSARFKKGHCIGNLFGFPTSIFRGNTRNLLAINQGLEARELWMAALHLGADQPFRNIPTGRAR
ncbi:hypothetical protein Cgig2_001791 [Carnegiea gigantea]|uniref:Uncharacterized protein n=1 Tax=Carnegiea gigantea TaxID=171969 RepID=A0A9Q1KH12_9CARY|nr:hypothetical protein Cgig2_001791 [Carnegiea gigantea]